jgi:putative tryptophan/tyrosine transport system substrate-binding protein
MKRREFITLLGSTVAWPYAVRAQQSAMPVIGYLCSGDPDRFAPMTRGYLQGLAETGFVEGRNVTIEYRWASGHYDQLPGMVADLIARHVSVIDATAGSAPGLAAKAATTTIPIVFQTGSDPVKDGLVSSINRPTGNITGVTRLGTTVEPRRLELLHELVPSAQQISFLVNPTNPASDHQLQEMQDAAKSLGLKLDVMKAGTESELLAVFEILSQQRSALLLATDPFLDGNLLLTLAARYRIPVGHFDRTQVAAGALMSYGASLVDSFRQVGVYTGRILKGAKPTDLPIMQPTKFELVINLKTAKALGLAVSQMLLATADEVIE